MVAHQPYQWASLDELLLHLPIEKQVLHESLILVSLLHSSHVSNRGWPHLVVHYDHLLLLLLLLLLLHLLMLQLARSTIGGGLLLLTLRGLSTLNVFLLHVQVLQLSLDLLLLILLDQILLEVLVVDLVLLGFNRD